MLKLFQTVPMTRDQTELDNLRVKLTISVCSICKVDGQRHNHSRLASWWLCIVSSEEASDYGQQRLQQEGKIA